MVWMTHNCQLCWPFFLDNLSLVVRRKLESYFRRCLKLVEESLRSEMHYALSHFLLTRLPIAPEWKATKKRTSHRPKTRSLLQ